MDEQTQVIPEKRQLRCGFTEAEMLDMGRDLCEAIRVQGQLTEELATIKSDYKGKIGDRTTRINELVAKVTSGCENRDVDCEKHIDFVQNIVRVVRMDTGEIIEERGLFHYERQMALEVGRQSALETLDEAVRRRGEVAVEVIEEEEGEGKVPPETVG